MPGMDPSISDDGVIAYSVTIKNRPVGRPVALIHGSQRTTDRIPAGFVVNSNAHGKVLLTRVDPPVDAQAGYVWEPDTGVLHRSGEAGSMITDDGSVLILRSAIRDQPRAAYLWHDHTLTQLPEPPGWTTRISGGYGWRSMVGTVIQGANGRPDTGPAYAAEWRYGELDLLPGLGGRAATAAASNSASVIVGGAQVSGGPARAMRWIGGRGADLGTLGGQRSWASHVSKTGVAVGWATTSTGARHAAAWMMDGRIIDLGAALPEPGDSTASGIKGNRIFGSRTGPDGTLIPVVWTVTGLS
jgi:probable HAF family extracellular repeat protein